MQEFFFLQKGIIDFVVLTEEETCIPQCSNCKKRGADYSKCVKPIKVSRFQGGKKEKKEVVYDTAIREVWEETCKTVKCTREELEKAYKNGHYIDYKKKKRTTYRLYLLYKPGVKVRNYNRNRARIVKNNGNATFLETLKMHHVFVDRMMTKNKTVKTVDGQVIRLDPFLSIMWKSHIISSFTTSL